MSDQVQATGRTVVLVQKSALHSLEFHFDRFVFCWVDSLKTLEVDRRSSKICGQYITLR